MRPPMRAWATAVVLTALTAWLLAALALNTKPPSPMFAVGVTPECPPAGARNFYFPSDIADGAFVKGQDVELSRFLVGLLGPSRPMWCGIERDDIYRLVAIGYPKDLVVTITAPGAPGR